jgi:undecaprenyl-diphosphatase
MIVSFFKGCRRKGDAVCEIIDNSSATGAMVIPIILACVPAAVVGILFEDTLEASVRKSPVAIAVMLVIMGIVMLLAEKVGQKKRTLEEMNSWDWITIGLAQALALIPGVSRSGSTISMGLFRNLRRDSAAYFSFLLSAPIIFGASAKKLLEVLQTGLPQNQIMPFIIGILTAAVVGYLCIAFLMSYLRKHSIALFVWYRFALAAVVMVFWAIK